ncbi:MAG: glycosyltransferase family 4 protein [Candidatus Rokuibacteriota bacterium]
MRILLTCNYSPWSAYSGGGQRSTHELASALARRGHDVTVVFTKAPWERVHPPASLPYRLRWAALLDSKSRAQAPLRVLSAWTVARTVRRELTRGQPVVVHAQGEEAARLHRLRPHYRFGLVVTPRYPSLPRGLFAPRRSLARGLGLLAGYGKYAALGVALRTADVCAPPSHYGGDLIRRAYQVPSDRIRPVHNGVPAEFLEHVWRPPSNRETRPALFFGRLERSKGLDVLLQALRELGGDAPRIRVVGEGPYRDTVARMRDELGLTHTVELRGWVDQHELGRLLTESSMAILPSRDENFSLAVLSAMAVGTPLIATRVGGTSELVEHGHHGVLCPAGDVRSLRDAIEQVSTQPEHAAQLAARGRQRVRDAFTWDAAACKFESLYEQLG